MVSRVRDLLLPVAGRLSPRPASRLDGPVLVLQPDHLGDVLLSQPAVRLIRERHPHQRIIGIVGPWSREIAQLAWDVDELRTVEFPGFTRANAGSALDPYRLLRSTAIDLQELYAAVAYVLRPDAWWAAWLAALISPQVVAANEPRVRDFATTLSPLPPNAHAAQRAAAIVEPMRSIAPSTAPLALPINDHARHWVSTNIREPFAVIHCGSGAPVKEWVTHGWVAVGNALRERGFNVVLTGSPAEAPAVAAVAESLDGCINLAGRTTLVELIELLRMATIVVGPDCGPLHLAVATGAPTVHLFGPSDQRRYGPWGDPSRHAVVSAGMFCGRCGDLSMNRPAGCGCMLAIRPPQVIAAIDAVLGAEHG